MSELLTVFFGSIILTSVAIVAHLMVAYHPYHKPIPLAISSLMTTCLAVFALSLTNHEMSYAEIIRVSVSESVSSLLDILPLFYVFITIILARVSFQKRKKEPL
tara:strand:+ start:1137 stop:1448 length:312 start_codon:yes stop_codon:yes gene_type:complete